MAGRHRFCDEVAQRFRPAAKFDPPVRGRTLTLRTLYLFLLSSLGFAACGGDIVTNADSNRHAIFSEVAEECQASPEVVLGAHSEADIQSHLVGRWVRCLDARFPGEDIGVEFTADHHWYSLTLDPEGKVIRVPGIDYRGRWKYYPIGAATPLDDNSPFEEFGFQTGAYEGETLTNPPVFFEHPNQMRVTYSPWESRYVRFR